LKNFPIHVSKIELSTGRTLTPLQVIRESPHWIAEGSQRGVLLSFYGKAAQRPAIRSGCSSQEGVYGPREAQGKPLWYNGSGEEVQRTGHADVLEDGEGNWWGVFLGVKPVKGDDGNCLEPQNG